MPYYRYPRRRQKKIVPKKILISTNKIIKLGQLEKLDSHELLEQERLYKEDIQALINRLDIKKLKEAREDLKEALKKIDEQKQKLREEMPKAFGEENLKREVSYWIKRKSSFWGANKNEGFKNTKFYMIDETKGDKLLKILHKTILIKKKKKY